MLKRIVTAYFVICMVAACAPVSAPATTAPAQPTVVPATKEPAQPTVVAPSSPQAKRLVVAVPEDLAGLDPINSGGPDVNANVYAHLTTMKIDFEKKTYLTDQPAPEIAESWQVAPDRKSLTWKINPKATFSDGSPVTADDVVYTYQRLLAIFRTPARQAGITDTKQVQAVDQRTVKMVFGDGYPEMTRMTLIGALGAGQSILKKQYVESHATSDDPWATKWLTKNALGAGPYVVESWKPGEEVVLKARSDWWGERKPYYTEIRYRIIPDSETRLMLLRSGEVDVAYFLSPSQLDLTKSDPKLQVISVPQGQEIVAFRMNTKSPPFDDINIRMAIIKAIPYKAIIDQTLLGYGSEVKSPCGLTAPGYKEYSLYETNLKEAKDLIAKSKYAKGVPSFTLVIPTRYPERVMAATLIQASLLELGIDMRIQQKPYAAYYDGCSIEPRYDVNLHSMNPYFNDCLFWTMWMFGSTSRTNCTGYSNPIVDAATNKSLITLDPVEYDKLVKTVVDDILVGEALMAPLYQANWSIAAKKDLTGFVYMPGSLVEYMYVGPVSK